MELRYVHEFCVLAEIGNYLDAACDLDISQSTLSRHIFTLEAELGASLFTRTTRQVKLNDYGAIFLPLAKQMLELEQRVHNEYARERRSVKKVLSIGAIPAMTQYDVTAMLARFQKYDSAVTFEVIEGESAELKEMVRNKHLDFAFVRELDESEKEFTSILYTTDRLAAILPAAHPLAKAPSIKLAQLRGESFLLLPEGTLMHKLCVSACMAAGFEPKVCYTGNLATAIVNLVANGMGIALLNKRSATAFNASTVATVELTPLVETRIDLIYLKDQLLTDPCWSFLRNVNEYIHTPDPASRRAVTT
jgi:DNA-binding transcriptional LysR family regulator